MKTKSIWTLVALVAVTLTMHVAAQSPAPVIIQAVGNTPRTVAPAPVIAPPLNTAPATIATLQTIKAANDEILKKQTATLQQLEEIEKAAEQIRIFSKRG